MRHRIAGNRLSRNRSLRKATMRDMAKATLFEQRICTTKAKAKEARKLVDQLITLGKKGGLIHRRRAFAILCDHQLVKELFDKTAPRFKNRVGGYTRIIPLSLRRGDNAQMVYLELTEKSEVIVSKPRSSAAKKTKDLTPEIAVETTQSSTSAAPEAKETKKKVVPPDPGKSKKGHEQDDKSKKNWSGGLRKFFRRKSGEG